MVYYIMILYYGVLNCAKSMDRSHAQLLLTIVSPWRSLSHTHTHTLTHTHSKWYTRMYLLYMMLHDLYVSRVYLGLDKYI